MLCTCAGNLDEQYLSLIDRQRGKIHQGTEESAFVDNFFPVGLMGKSTPGLYVPPNVNFWLMLSDVSHASIIVLTYELFLVGKTSRLYVHPQKGLVHLATYIFVTSTPQKKQSGS